MTVTHPPRDTEDESRLEPEDAAVIERSRREPECFSVIFDRHFARIHRYIASRLGAAAADDVAAETFLAAFAKRHRYDLSRPDALAWLYGIATNMIRRHRRTEVRAYRTLMRATAEIGPEGFADQVAERVSAQRMQPRLAAGLAALSAGDRDALLLVAYGELSYAEVAYALGIAPGTVASRLNRARKHLRQVLGAHEQEMHTDG